MLPVSKAQLGTSAYVWILPYKHSHHYPVYICFSLLHSEAYWWKSWQTLASQCHWVHSAFDVSVVGLWKVWYHKGNVTCKHGLWTIARMCVCSLSPLTHLLCWQLIAPWWKNFGGVLSKAEPLKNLSVWLSLNMSYSLGEVIIAFSSSAPSSADDCLRSKMQDVLSEKLCPCEYCLLCSTVTDMFWPK